MMQIRWSKIFILILAVGALWIGTGCQSLEKKTKSSLPHYLSGFETSKHWNEQIRDYTVEPEVRVFINAPSAQKLDPRKPLRIAFFALPNGNTIEQTIGRQMEPGLDWHYDIQHIGAQTRLFREVFPEENLVTVYLAAEQKSWPSWRKKRGYQDQLIADLLQSIASQFSSFDTRLNLTGHSGGGSLMFGYLNSMKQIPDSMKRIVFLDSNYGYSDKDSHGDKLIEWLKRATDHFLTVIAYDDREIMFNGKKVLGPTGGTWRATHRMIDRFQQDIPLTMKEEGDLIFYKGFNGQVAFILHKNPENKILHTVQVEKNGFLHGLTAGTAQEAFAWEYYGPRAYEKWIQPN